MIEKWIKNISKYLYIFLKSLRKLENYHPYGSKCLYRYISHKVPLKEDLNNKILVSYKVGNRKTFWAFTSTSFERKTTFTFLKDEKVCEKVISKKKILGRHHVKINSLF